MIVQPPPSQRKPSPRPTSRAARASPSCSSQRDNSNAAPRPPCAVSAPVAPRAATSLPSRPTMMSGRGNVGASASPAATPASPSNRQRVRHRHSHNPPPAISANAANGIAGSRPTAPGSPATTRAHHVITSMPKPITHERQRFQPERHQHQRRQRRRHHHHVAHRDRDQVGDDRVLLALVEMVGGERTHRDAGDQRRPDDAAEEQQHAAEVAEP